ncbi:MAG: DUF4355 domain-containing protein [Xanthomonadales bacterium]|nr:DUF4355 domain-containing protein [Xanthomonadales bacterium]
MSETDTAEVVETTTATVTQAPASKTLDELQAENERMSKALKDANREAADRRKKLDAYEKAEQSRKDAELSESQRLQKEVETLRAQAERTNRELMQRDIAAEVGLPAIFAARITGNDKETMLEDAKAMLSALPSKPTPSLSATNPGSGQSRSETDEERRKRLGLR